MGLLGAIALVGLIVSAVALAPRELTGRFEGRVGRVLLGLAVGLVAAVTILLPKIDFLPDNTETPLLTVIAIAGAALAVGGTWYRWTHR